MLLAQRIAGEPAKTARHLNDLLRLLPPNVDRELLLFDDGRRRPAAWTPDDDGARGIEGREASCSKPKPKPKADGAGRQPASRAAGGR